MAITTGPAHDIDASRYDVPNRTADPTRTATEPNRSGPDLRNRTEPVRPAGPNRPGAEANHRTEPARAGEPNHRAAANRTTDPGEANRTAPDPLPAGREFSMGVLMLSAVTIFVLTFMFSYGNVKQLALVLGVLAWIAPLIGPAVDLSVTGLIIAVQWLTLAGVPRDQLKPAHKLLWTCGAATLVLNSAPSAILGYQHGDATQYGKAAIEAVAPFLLVAWAHVGPILIRLFVQVKAQHVAAVRAARQAAVDAARLAEAQRDAAEQAAQRAAQDAADQARRDQLAAEQARLDRLAEVERLAAAERQADRDREQALALARAEADRAAAAAARVDAERAQLAARAEADRAEADRQRAEADRIAAEALAAEANRTTRAAERAARKRTGSDTDRTTPRKRTEPAVVTEPNRPAVPNRTTEPDRSAAADTEPGGAIPIVRGIDGQRVALRLIRSKTAARGFGSWADLRDRNKIGINELHRLTGLRKERIYAVLEHAETLLSWEDAGAELAKEGTG